MTSQKTIFISYSHKDKVFIDRLLVHLRPLEKLYNLNIWNDYKIKPGSKWKEEIENNLESAETIIVLLSPDFLASEFVMDIEYPKMLKKAKEDGSLLLVILARYSRRKSFRYDFLYSSWAAL